MTDLQRNQSADRPGGYHENVRKNSSNNAENVTVDVDLVDLAVTPAVARALLRLLIGVHRKRGKQINPREGT
ncbi:hypothetical protein Aca07nite_73380 [Actinoplanes capillaceus]|uniref:Uncharacterized protein n=2 Tax=Actinoplanes campanulatus TaxID=113559 RepID=A0ABQ3WV55_9ACTN|nr:hypothetical protein Aca07nite_73380 [Actinoplanes capillaceus]